MSHALLPKSGVLWNNSRTPAGHATNLFTVATKYYTHFVTHTGKARTAPADSEWSGVVELREPLPQARANCARCWHRVSTWIRTTSASCTGLDCTDRIPWRTSFPSSKVRPYQPQASKPGVFFRHAKTGFHPCRVEARQIRPLVC